MTYHWIDGMTAVSSTDLAAMIKVNLEYLPAGDPARSEQENLLLDLSSDYQQDMTTWEIQILDDDHNIVRSAYHIGWFQEEAEAAAQKLNRSAGGAMWQVLRIKN